jgi:hypothetical protein
MILKVVFFANGFLGSDLCKRENLLFLIKHANRYQLEFLPASALQPFASEK